MHLRNYEPDKDADAVKQMWIEAGWGSYSDEERLFVESQRTLVAEFAGQAAALVASSRGDIRYLQETLPLSGIGAVITALTARRQQLSSRLTARRIRLGGDQMISNACFISPASSCPPAPAPLPRPGRSRVRTPPVGLCRPARPTPFGSIPGLSFPSSRCAPAARAR